MLPIDWKTAIAYANLVAITESVPPAGNDTLMKQKIAALGYTYLQTLYANELATDIDAHLGEVVSFGFLAVSPARNWSQRSGARIPFSNGFMMRRS